MSNLSLEVVVVGGSRARHPPPPPPPPLNFFAWHSNLCMDIQVHIFRCMCGIFLCSYKITYSHKSVPILCNCLYLGLNILLGIQTYVWTYCELCKLIYVFALTLHWVHMVFHTWAHIVP